MLSSCTSVTAVFPIQDAALPQSSINANQNGPNPPDQFLSKSKFRVLKSQFQLFGLF